MNSHLCVRMAAAAEIRELRAENSELADQCVQLTTLLKDGGICAHCILARVLHIVTIRD